MWAFVINDAAIIMPVILRIKGYRFWFYSADLREPPHIHVGKAGNEAKYWLTPISLARSRGFRPPELSEIEDILVAHRVELLIAWQDAQRQSHDREA
ncbi:DUF4160 domain-containing protein [Promineifilum sp.]|uniref:DUF4160 domain-containing protein n=1 Tax=Promineifilum sp. TaxID=2664178 RepID=UPI0035B0BB9C